LCIQRLPRIVQRCARRYRDEMAPPPSERVRELETLLAKIQNAGMMQLNYDMWDQHGAEHATPEERARMDAALANATREQIAAKTALEALVAQTRGEAPAELAAWADAHDAYLAAFLEDCATLPQLVRQALRCCAIG